MKNILRTIALVAALIIPSAAHATAKFLVLCTTACTWDNTNDAIWSLSSGGVNNTTHPVAADTVTLDANSCVGGVTCTITVAANLSITSLTMGACTATTTGCILDFSANNNSITLSTFSNTGTGTRTLNMGNNTWTLTSALGVVVWNMTTTGNLTFNANSSTINFAATTTAARSMNPGNGITYNIVTIAANTSTGPFTINVNAATTFTTLNLTTPNYIVFAAGLTVTNAVNWVGTSTNPLFIITNSFGNPSGLTVANGSTITWAGIRDIQFVGGPITATNSFNLGDNSGITITAPGGSGGCILGGWLLWRDMPNNLNDNFPAWLEKAA